MEQFAEFVVDQVDHSLERPTILRGDNEFKEKFVEADASGNDSDCGTRKPRSSRTLRGPGNQAEELRRKPHCSVSSVPSRPLRETSEQAWLQVWTAQAKRAPQGRAPRRLQWTRAPPATSPPRSYTVTRAGANCLHCVDHSCLRRGGRTPPRKGSVGPASAGRRVYGGNGERVYGRVGRVQEDLRSVGEL